MATSATLVRVIPQMPPPSVPQNKTNIPVQQQRSVETVPLYVVGSFVWNEKLGKRLENLRLGKDITQMQIYEELIKSGHSKISNTTVSRLESGVLQGDKIVRYKSAKSEHLVPILEILGYTVSEFYKENADALED